MAEPERHSDGHRTAIDGAADGERAGPALRAAGPAAVGWRLARLARGPVPGARRRGLRQDQPAANAGRPVAFAGRAPGVSAAAGPVAAPRAVLARPARDRKSTRLNSSHSQISYAVFCLK